MHWFLQTARAQLALGEGFCARCILKNWDCLVPSAPSQRGIERSTGSAPWGCTTQRKYPPVLVVLQRGKEMEGKVTTGGEGGGTHTASLEHNPLVDRGNRRGTTTNLKAAKRAGETRKKGERMEES